MLCNHDLLQSIVATCIKYYLKPHKYIYSLLHTVNVGTITTQVVIRVLQSTLILFRKPDQLSCEVTVSANI